MRREENQPMYNAGDAEETRLSCTKSLSKTSRIVDLIEVPAFLSTNETLNVVEKSWKTMQTQIHLAS